MNLQDLLTWEPMGESDFYARCLDTLLSSFEKITGEAVMIRMESLPQGLMKVSSVQEMDSTKLLKEDRHPYYLVLRKEPKRIRIHFNGPSYLEWLKYEPMKGRELKDLTLPIKRRITKTRITVQKQRPLRALP